MLLKEYNTKKARNLFRGARFNALYRGVEFHFQYEEWVLWWVTNCGANWIKHRGRRSTQFCMARKGAKGPYTPGMLTALRQEKIVLKGS